MTESKWTTEMRKWLESHGFMCLKLHGHAMQAPGWPDLYVAGGRAVWVEVKSLGNVPDALQLVIIGQLRDHGIDAVVMTRTSHAPFNPDELVCVDGVDTTPREFFKKFSWR